MKKYAPKALAFFCAVISCTTLSCATKTPVPDSNNKEAAIAPASANTVYARTDDGWNLALHRVAPQNPQYSVPVILCHDIAQNSRIWDLKSRSGLAPHLSRMGFDVWTVDLRGAGSSNKEGWRSRQEIAKGGQTISSRFGKEDWTLDDLIHLDIPAVLRTVQKQTGQQKISWVGLGFGASAMAGFLETHQSDAVRNFVACGMPVAFPKPVLNHALAALAKKSGPTALAVVFNDRWNNRNNGAGSPAGLAGLDGLFCYLPNVEGRTVEELRREVTEDISPGTLEQFLLMLRSGKFLSSDSHMDYTKGLDKIAVPTLLIGGRMDNLAGEVNLYITYQLLSSPDKTLLVLQPANGSSREYGHNDLLVGAGAAQDVFPAIAAWLAQRA